MSSYTYKVVPFRAQVKGAAAADEIARQLQSSISGNAIDGYELHQVATVTVEVAPGCLGALTGQKAQAITYEQLVFRKPQ